MKYSVGYRFYAETGAPFAEELCALNDVAEVYFPWLSDPSGRGPLANANGLTDWDAQHMLERDLIMLRERGIALNLLFNANCCGGGAVSIKFENHIRSVVERVFTVAGRLEWVTTASPFVAAAMKKHFPSVRVRASVNMRIGNVWGMEYLSDLFDGFYMQREYNRDLGAIERLKAKCEAAGKSLHLLANSGCAAYCSAQVFHDNLVAHYDEVEGRENARDFCAVNCESFYNKRENRWKLLRNTWIRPEDIAHYEPYFDAVKLATRQTWRPLAVVKAYIAKSHRGNLLDLFEPNHSRLIAPQYIRNAAFPEDWFDKTSNCGGNCGECGYCERVYKQVVTDL